MFDVHTFCLLLMKYILHSVAANGDVFAVVIFVSLK
jgi:hypothetical protein